MLIVAEEHPENFLPLSLTRATFELRYGALRRIRLKTDTSLMKALSFLLKSAT